MTYGRIRLPTRRTIRGAKLASSVAHVGRVRRESDDDAALGNWWVGPTEPTPEDLLPDGGEA